MKRHPDLIIFFIFFILLQRLPAAGSGRSWPDFHHLVILFSSSSSSSSCCRGYQQQDAHEFMRYLLDRLHTELLTLLPFPESSSPVLGLKGRSTIVTTVFGGLLQSEVNCLTCGMYSKKHDPFLGQFYLKRRKMIFILMFIQVFFFLCKVGSYLIKVDGQGRGFLFYRLQ